MNSVTGEKQIDICGQKYVLRFSWKALSEIERRYGDKPNLFDAEVIANVAAAGLRERHPEMTAERIMDLSPPLVPLAQAIQQALQWAYFGGEIIPGESESEKKNRRQAGWSRLIGWLFGRESPRRNSGI